MRLLVGQSVVLAERHHTRRATTPAASCRQAKACARSSVLRQLGDDFGGAVRRLVFARSDSMTCICIGEVGGAVARSERRSAGHATDSSVGGMVATQLDDAADDASRRS